MTEDVITLQCNTVTMTCCCEFLYLRVVLVYGEIISTFTKLYQRNKRNKLSRNAKENK